MSVETEVKSKFHQRVNSAFHFFFGKRFNHTFERVVLYMALGGFLLHLIAIYLHDFGWVTLYTEPGRLLDSPVSAIYTPFSLILVYEVYLLIYYLPRSFSTSIGKQYEIISLVVIRRIFKDISNVKLTPDWFSYKYNVQLTADLIGILVLFLLIYWFNRLCKQKPPVPTPDKIENFINFKKLFSIILLPIVLFLGAYSLVSWLVEIEQYAVGNLDELSNVNNIFYDEFFGLLVFVDVTILIVSLLFTVRYSQLIRNTGFVISTILIRISFSASGILNIILIIVAILFGTLILALYNIVERQGSVDETVAMADQKIEED